MGGDRAVAVLLLCLHHARMRVRSDSAAGVVMIAAVCCLPACGEDSAAAAAAQVDAAPDQQGLEDSGADGGLPEAAEASVWESGPIRVVEEPGSGWHVAIEAAEVVARHAAADVALVVDPTNGAADGRYAGVYVFVGGAAQFEGTYNDTHCSMFVPDRPYMNQQDVSVVASGASLVVTMTEGSLSQMPDSKFPSDDPFVWKSSWSLDPGGLRLAASGLYYLLPPKDGCGLKLLGEGGNEIGTVQIESDTAPFLKYFLGVRTIEIASSVAGTISIATDAEKLQVEVPSYPNTGLFELDFDHSFKDLGQSEVHAEMVLPIGR